MSIGTILGASPAALRAAAGKLGSASEGLSTQTSGITGATDAVVGEWSGIAARLCATHCERLASDARTGVDALQMAGNALIHLANELDYAQELARQAQSYAASANSMRANIATMEPSPMIRMMSEEAAAASGQASYLEAEADRVARAAASHAAGILSDVAGKALSQRDPAWGGVLTLSGKELNAFFTLQLAGLPDQVQSLAGRELAGMVEEAASSEEIDAAALRPLFEMLESNAHDGDFAAGFFNELGAEQTAALSSRLIEHLGYFTEEVDEFMRPLSIALGSASRDGLDSGFAKGLLDSMRGPRVEVYIAHIVQHGTYESDFIVTLASEIVRLLGVTGGLDNHLTIETRPTDIAGTVLEAVARTPEAARSLLLKDFPYDYPEMPQLEGRSYLDSLLSATYMDESGLHAVLLAATNPSVPPAEANAVLLKLIQEAPKVGPDYMEASTHQLIVSIAAQHWDEFSRSAWEASNGTTDWALHSGLRGVTDEHLFMSMEEALAFMEFAVADPGSRIAMEHHMQAHVDELIREALAMPEGNKRNHLLEQAGAAMELFSLGDTRYQRELGAEIDKDMKQFGTLAKIVSGELIGKIHPGGKAVHLVVKQLAGKAIENAFRTDHELRAMSATEQQELKNYLELDLKILGQAAESGIITPKQFEYELERLYGEGGKSRSAISEKLDPLTRRPSEVMHDLRLEWLHRRIDG